jgi:2-isopropylmalate synthase
MEAAQHIRIFDTTLRDGEQSPGATMNLDQKLRVAHGLALLGVDVIEAGFPIASEGDFEAVRAIARSQPRSVDPPAICGLARAQAADIDRAWDAVRDAARPRLHVFLAASPIHRAHKLRMTPAEVTHNVRLGVERARALCSDVEFSPEDATRTEPDFLAEVVETAIAAGATTINVPDTVGYATPRQYAELIHHLLSTVREIGSIVVSAHCHDDLGLAVANSLAAIGAGARQVECTVNGIGERAGNCALEEVVMALRTRFDEYGLSTAIDPRGLCAISRLVEEASGIAVQRHKAVVGRNAFAHEAGIHQHGMLRHRDTYEILRAEDVGSPGTDLVLGKHSGRAAFAARLRALGHAVEGEPLNRLFGEFKRLADRRKEIHDSDLLALLDRGAERSTAAQSRRVRS